jgi:hypothetical protein
MCCYCVEIKVGVAIIGILQVLTALSNLSMASSGFYWRGYGYNNWYTLVALVVDVPSIVGAGIFVQWFLYHE